MATNRRVVSVTFTAAADLSAAQYRIVGMGTAGVNTLAAGTSGMPLGVLMNKPAALNRAAEVAIVGAVVKLEAGAACSAGDPVVAVTGGRGSPVAASGGGAASSGTAFVVGICVAPAAGSAGIMEVAVNPHYYVHA